MRACNRGRGESRSEIWTVAACWLLLGSLAIVAACGGPSEPEVVVLMTEEEAAEARVADAEWVVTERLRGAGPQIVVLEPQIEATPKGLTAEVGKPFNLQVQFEDAGQPVDMASLRVRAKIGFLPKITLTEKLRPFITETVLDGRALEVPKGKYLIEISISDTEGATSSETIRVRVKD